MRPITQAEFEAILSDLSAHKKSLPKGEQLSLSNYLEDKGFSNELDGINFAVHQKTVTQTPGVSRSKNFTTANTVPRTTDILNNLDFSGCHLQGCNFDCCDLSGSNFENLDIADCSFNQTVMNQCKIKNVRFYGSEAGCSFENTSFDYSQIQQTSFDQCRLLHSSFNFLKPSQEVIFENCSINFVSMLGGSTQGVIIRAAQKKTISLTTDQALTLENITIKALQPAVLLSWNNLVPGITPLLTEKMLSARKLSTVRMDYNPQVDAVKLDSEINELNHLTSVKFEQLKIEVVEKAKTIDAQKDDHPISAGDVSSNIDANAQLKKIITQLQVKEKQPLDEKVIFEEFLKKNGISFPMLMIEIMREKHAENPESFPEMAALYSHAKSIYDAADGILIPGGQDIDPRFYGQSLHPKTNLTMYSSLPGLTDPRRDVIEFSLVYAQQRASIPKPLCGICRGSQVIAASYGGTMFQHIDDDKRWAYFVEEITPNIPRKDSLFPWEACELSTHTQLVNRIGQDRLSVLFIHHQGYNLDTAHGLTSTASTKTVSGIPIDIVGEHLQQNITSTQAHPEFAFDYTDTSEGVSAHVSRNVADGIFEQFEMRVRAYQNSRHVDLDEITQITSSPSK